MASPYSACPPTALLEKVNRNIKKEKWEITAKKKDMNWDARTPNAHIAKIAALPRVDRFCVFSPPLLALIKC